MKQLKKTLLTLVALLAVTAGAWAEESETINTATDETTVYTGTHFKITASLGCDGDGIILWSGSTSGTATIEALNGENITKIEMHMSYGGYWSTYTTTTAGKLVATNSDSNANDISVTDINATSVTIGTSNDNEGWIQINKFVIYYGDAPAPSGPTVTFTASDLADGSSITKDGVTLTGYGQYGINMNGITGPGEFTNTLGGNFTKIVVTADNLPSGDGWSAGTWTGSASSVSFTGNIDTWGNEFSIVCTLETASSGPEVAWDKAEKSGSFTMPGGNVTLEPEYYPQAALTAAPTAINDVPATTDGAIVEAGTVKNIGETTTAQGTVMYYVSTTALDDAALLALAADAWTADVPTAESFTAAGQAYVYYYVRGNDSDTDDEIFSDGDILAANALTVTIAAAPTYAVTFADDTAEPTLWTASPNTDVTKGQTVTVTYSGTKKVLGVKAEKKAAELSHALADAVVGEIVGTDGKAYAVADKDNLPDGVTAAGMVAYKSGSNGLVIALTDEASMMDWNTANGATGAAAHTPTVTSQAWKLPSQDEWKQMFAANGGNETSYSGLNTAITTAGGAALLEGDNNYWSSTEVGTANAQRLHLASGTAYFTDVKRTNANRVRACLAF